MDQDTLERIVEAVAHGYGAGGFTRDDVVQIADRVAQWITDAALLDLLRDGRIGLRLTADGSDVIVTARDAS